MSTEINVLLLQIKKYKYIGNDQEMTQSERNSHSINRGVGKTKWHLGACVLIPIPRKHIVSQVSSYSPILHSVTRAELKYENLHTCKAKQHKK